MPGRRDNCLILRLIIILLGGHRVCVNVCICVLMRRRLYQALIEVNSITMMYISFN